MQYSNLKKETKTRKMKIYNLSLSTSDIDDKGFEILIESNLVSVHDDIKANEKNSQCNLFISANKGDVFYLNRSGSVELIGMFVDERPLISILPQNSDWIDRSFKVLKRAISPKAFNSSINKTWSPKDSSGFMIISDNDYSELESSIFQPVFNVSLTDIESLKIAELKNTELSIEDCLKLQKKFKKLENDENYLLEQINSISYVELLKIAYRYRGKGDIEKQPVVNLRYQLLKELLEKNKLSIKLINDLKNDIASKFEKNVFLSWKRPFRVLYTFMYAEFKLKLINCFEQLILKLQTELNIKDKTKHNLVHLDGAQNQGNKEIWFAIYNNSHSSQKTAKQLFFKVEDKFEYGLLYKQDPSKDKLHTAKDFDYKNLLNVFEQYKDNILNDRAEQLKENTQNDNSEQNIMNKTNSLNQILFGPPGTGKTYSTAIKALSIIEQVSEDELNLETFGSLKKRYDKYLAGGQIVFTTFHQSMAYEDFVEGLKPIKPEKEDGIVTYDVKPGIFISLCKSASPEYGNFDKVIKSFEQEVFENGESEPLTIEAKGTTFDVVYRGTSVFYVQPHASVKDKPWYPVNIVNIEKVFRTGEYEGIYNPTYVREIIKYLEDNKGLKKGANPKSKENYVLIIDEINRGNVSAIFGELITLIEESKRKGNAEALEITLPYSKEKFSVPKNLYIIGTMNTADRSVEALDSALRRRFSFTEMQPKPELIETEGNKIRYIDPEGANIDLVDLLKKINSRIEVLLDKDHLIGHSFFMKVKNLADLKRAFTDEIIPLLQEYFFGDYGQISLVLGEGFCKGKKALANGVKFASISNDSVDYDYSDKLIYRFPELDDDEFKDAITELLK